MKKKYFLNLLGLVFLFSSVSNAQLIYNAGWGNQSCQPCDAGNHKEDGICIETQYIAEFSTIEEVPLSTCNGSQNKTATLISCSQVHDGQIVDLNSCADKVVPSILFQSPAGTLNIPINKGLKSIFCDIGKMESEGIVSYNCDEGYVESGGICVVGARNFTFQLSESSLIIPQNANTISVKLSAEDTATVLDPVSKSANFSVSNNVEISPILSGIANSLMILKDEEGNTLTPPLMVSKNETFLIAIQCLPGFQASGDSRSCVAEPPPIFMQLSRNASSYRFEMVRKTPVYGWDCQLYFNKINPDIEVDSLVDIKRYDVSSGPMVPGSSFHDGSQSGAYLTASGSEWFTGFTQGLAYNRIQYIFVFSGVHRITGKTVKNSIAITSSYVGDSIPYTHFSTSPMQLGDIKLAVPY